VRTNWQAKTGKLQVTLDIAKELEKTLHLHSEELPYVKLNNTGEMRFLQASVQDDFYVTQFRAPPGLISGLHKHRPGKGASGFTLKGRWGHDHQYLYQPGTLIYETPGVIHQFFNGPEVSEVLFFGALDVDFVHSETLEVTGSITGRMTFQKYLDSCEEQGIKARFLSPRR
jgi:2,4'-dihydroxyacetophenone dioxygenase